MMCEFSGVQIQIDAQRGGREILISISGGGWQNGWLYAINNPPASSLLPDDSTIALGHRD